MQQQRPVVPLIATERRGNQIVHATCAVLRSVRLSPKSVEWRRHEGALYIYSTKRSGVRSCGRSNLACPITTNTDHSRCRATHGTEVHPTIISCLLIAAPVLPQGPPSHGHRRGGGKQGQGGDDCSFVLCPCLPSSACVGDHMPPRKQQVTCCPAAKGAQGGHCLSAIDEKEEASAIVIWIGVLFFQELQPIPTYIPNLPSSNGRASNGQNVDEDMMWGMDRSLTHESTLSMNPTFPSTSNACDMEISALGNPHTQKESGRCCRGPCRAFLLRPALLPTEREGNCRARPVVPRAPPVVPLLSARASPAASSPTAAVQIVGVSPFVLGWRPHCRPQSRCLRPLHSSPRMKGVSCSCQSRF
mmetsp:Transcript_37899/g.61725  ORF Transcript_37899/g.61725 Transcript_37899/m.61725 type:complete len:359 (+) Transcript_37899:630-1706(+)